MHRWLAAALVALLLGAAAARAQETANAPSPSVVLRADDVTYDKAQGTER